MILDDQPFFNFTFFKLFRINDINRNLFGQRK